MKAPRGSLLVRRDNVPLPNQNTFRRVGLNGCDIWDPSCECSKATDGNLEYFCGYVDPAWHALPTTHALKRSVDLMADPISRAKRDDTESEFDGSDDAGQELGRRQAAGPTRPLSQAILFEVKESSNPIIDAVATLGYNDTLPHVTSLIRSRVPWGTRGKFVQGLKGEVVAPVTIHGKAFNKGALWTVRWDYSWYGEGGALPNTGRLGAHVELLVQDAATPVEVYLAFYYPPSDPANTAEHSGDYYYTNILSVLSSIAQSNDEGPAAPELAAANNVERYWRNAAIVSGI